MGYLPMRLFYFLILKKQLLSLCCKEVYYSGSKYKKCEVIDMNIGTYKEYFTEENLMGPNSIRLLKELLERYPLEVANEDIILDLGCGTGLTSFVIAKETGAKVYANDLWVSAEENAERFKEWGVSKQVTPVHEDANNLQFEKKMFQVLISIDSYHYFAGTKGFFDEKILPFIKDGGKVLIVIPGLKKEYEGRAEELLAEWATDESYMFKTCDCWKDIIGEDDRIESVETWEMDCFQEAWSEWFDTNAEFAITDRQYFETTIQPYTCFVGIAIQIHK